MTCAHVKLAMKDKPAGSHLHNEFLAQQGACDTSVPDVLQVLKAALEILAVCQHAQAGCTPFLICLGNLLQQQSRLWDTRGGCTAAAPDADICNIGSCMKARFRQAATPSSHILKYCHNCSQGFRAQAACTAAGPMGEGYRPSALPRLSALPRRQQRSHYQHAARIVEVQSIRAAMVLRNRHS